MLNLNVQEIRDNQDDRDSKAEVGQSNSKRRSRTAAIHNQSERVNNSNTYWLIILN